MCVADFQTLQVLILVRIVYILRENMNNIKKFRWRNKKVTVEPVRPAR